MSSAYQDHAKMLDALRSEYAEASLVFDWNGDSWEILPGGARFKRANDVGGFALSCDLQLTCTTAQFGDTLPDSGESMTYAGKEYTIVSVTPAPAAYQIRIEANLNVAGM
jgi:hypothetical protein